MSIQTLAGAGRSDSAHDFDGRVTMRRTCNFQTSCEPTSVRGDRDMKWAATIHDISVCGIGMILQRRYEPGTGLTIELPDSASDTTYTVLARVVNVKKQRDGRWHLGCNFVSELSEEEVETLIQIAQARSTPLEEESDPSSPGKVRAKKFVIFGVQLHITTNDGKEKVERYVRKLLIPPLWPLPAGKVLALPIRREGGPITPLRSRIDACYQKSDCWHVECTLLEPLPWQK
jgi:hypothetical protein